MSKYLKVNTDGGSRGNPGPSAAGWVAYEGDTEIGRGSEYLGSGTNNQAEYKAVIIALKWISENCTDNSYPIINFYLDSELVVRQLNGIYKIKDKELTKLAAEINSLIKKIPSDITFTAVRRELNKIADRLVNEKLDGKS